MTTLQNIETKVNEIIKENEVAIQSTREEFEKTMQNVAVAQAKLLQAQKEINAQKYAEAKTELWIAKQTQEFYEKRLEELSNDPIISYDEYHEIISEVQKQADQEQKRYYELACEKIKEIIELGDIALEKAKKTDSLLKEIEKNLSKDNEEYKKSKTGAYLSGFYSGISYNPQRALYVHKSQLENIIKNFSNK